MKFLGQLYANWDRNRRLESSRKTAERVYENMLEITPEDSDIVVVVSGEEKYASVVPRGQGAEVQQNEMLRLSRTGRAVVSHSRLGEPVERVERATKYNRA